MNAEGQHEHRQKRRTRLESSSLESPPKHWLTEYIPGAVALAKAFNRDGQEERSRKSVQDYRGLHHEVDKQGKDSTDPPRSTIGDQAPPEEFDIWRRHWRGRQGFQFRDS